MQFAKGERQRESESEQVEVGRVGVEGGVQFKKKKGKESDINNRFTRNWQVRVKLVPLLLQQLVPGDDCFLEKEVKSRAKQAEVKVELKERERREKERKKLRGKIERNTLYHTCVKRKSKYARFT